MSTATAQEPPRVELVAKLLRVAMDPAAPAAEAETAACHMVRTARRENVAMPVLATYLARDLRLPPPAAVKSAPARKAPEPPPAIFVSMTFGRYRGDAARRDRADRPVGYLLWVLDNCDEMRPTIRDAIETAVAYYTTGGRA
jgi:hypothetical protein